MSEHICWSTFPFSTLAQFGEIGTNQLNLAALANGETFGFPTVSLARFEAFGMFPASAIFFSFPAVVNAAIQSNARLLLSLVTGTARSEPPRNVGMYRPLM